MLPGEQRNDEQAAIDETIRVLGDDERAWREALIDSENRLAAVRVELQAAQDEATHLRQKNSAMHRRAQAAEAQIGTTIEDCIRQGRSLGRGLANAGFLGEREKRIKAEGDLAAARRTLDEIRRMAESLDSAAWISQGSVQRFLFAALAASPDTDTRARRYDQCDDTCTVDCGHCKGAGRPAAVPDTRDEESRHD